MEKDFYTDDFEQLLKDTTEDFRMYPSRKVWHSLYNDLHPAKKWPSFAVCFLLITAILFVGIHNNNIINADANNLLLENLPATESEEKLTSTTLQGDAAIQKNIRQQRSVAGTALSTPSLPLSNLLPTLGTTPMNAAVLPTTPITLQSDESLITANPDAIASSNDLAGRLVIHTTAVLPEMDYTTSTPEAPIARTSENKTPRTAEKMVEGTAASVSGDENISLADKPLDQESATIAPVTPQANSSLQSATKLNTADKEWIEDFAFHNKRAGNRFKTKFSTLVYITPSVGYRILNKNNNLEPVNALLVRGNATTVDAGDAISQQAALNLESGATGILDISRKLRIKAGVQFNYTNYISFAERLSHPTQTNILLNDLSTGNTMLEPFVSSYGNTGTDNSVRLNNKTAQFSLPIGADYKIIGTDKIKWYIGATIQPTYVAGGTAYLVSSDYKNYVDVPSMLRTWNLNAGFESFVSYKTKSGSVINLGPQFRYQLLSTYSNRYTYSERLYNIGIKLGITRKF